MKLVDSYFVVAVEGKSLIRDGKSIGVAAWLAPGKGYDNIENVGGAELRPMLLADAGKILRHKTTGEESTGRWLKDSTADEWEEIDLPDSEPMI